jgi:dipeptidyl aminopeptidase/acylaminoacyl peptidase
MEWNPMQSILKCFLTLFFLANYSAGYTQSLTPDDVLKFKRIGQVVVSPDASKVAFTTYEVKTINGGKEWQASLYLKDKNNVTLLLHSKPSIDNLTWSPDGKKITYLAKGKEFDSIWSMDAATHQSTQLFEFINDITDYKWAPNNKEIAFLSTEKDPANAPLKPIDVEKNYKNSRLYVLQLDIANTRKVMALTPKEIHIAGGFDWSPDGKQIVFSFQPREGALYWNESVIHIIDLATRTDTAIDFTHDHSGVAPTYSHDGKWIAFQTNLDKRSPEIKNQINLQNRICVFDTANKQTHCLKNTFNEAPQIMGWDALNTSIYALDVYKTTGFQLYALNIQSNTEGVNISNVEGFINPVSLTLNQKGDYFGFGYETVHNAPEAYMSRANPFKPQQISQLNTQQNNLGNLEVIRWKSKEGKEIEGIVVTPADFSPTKKYPLFVSVHGGPSGMWSKRYLGGCVEEYNQKIDPTSCWGHIASLGYVVLAPNVRGSTGYGTSFRISNYRDFGGGDLQDILSGIRFLIKKGTVDEKNLTIGGWSFGGYMSAWAISQTSIFKAAIDGDGNTNFISFSGTSDIPNYYEYFLGAPFWENSQLYLTRAPIMFTKNINTPLLIFSGENDNRVPLSQSYELYNALKRQHKPVKMFLLPGQGHMPTNANIIFESIQEVDKWLLQ